LASDGYTYKDRPNLCGKKRRVKLNNSTTVVIPCGAYRKQRDDLGRTHKTYDNRKRSKGAFKRGSYRKPYTKKLKTWLDPNYWTQKEGWAVNVFNVFVQRALAENDDLKPRFPKGTFNEEYNAQTSSQARFQLFQDTYKLLPPNEKLKQAVVLVFYLYHSKKGGLTGRKKMGYPATHFSNEKYTADELAEEHAKLMEDQENVGYDSKPTISSLPKLELAQNEAVHAKIQKFLGKGFDIFEDDLFLNSNDKDFKAQFDYYMDVFEQQTDRNDKIRESLNGAPEKQNSYNWKRDAFDVLRPFVHYMNVYVQADHEDVNTNRLKAFFMQISAFLFQYKTSEEDRTQNPYNAAWWNKNIKNLNELDNFYEALQARERESAELDLQNRRQYTKHKTKDDDDADYGGARRKRAAAVMANTRISASNSKKIPAVGRSLKRLLPRGPEPPVRESPASISPELRHLYKAILQLCDTLFQYRLNAVLPNLFKYELTKKEETEKIKPDKATTDYKYFTELTEEEERARDLRNQNQKPKVKPPVDLKAREDAQHSPYAEDRPEFVNTDADKKKPMLEADFLLAPRIKPPKASKAKSPKAKTMKAPKANTPKAKTPTPAAPKLSVKAKSSVKTKTAKASPIATPIAAPIATPIAAPIATPIAAPIAAPKAPIAAPKAVKAAPKAVKAAPKAAPKAAIAAPKVSKQAEKEHDAKQRADLKRVKTLIQERNDLEEQVRNIDLRNDRDRDTKKVNTDKLKRLKINVQKKTDEINALTAAKMTYQEKLDYDAAAPARAAAAKQAAVDALEGARNAYNRIKEMNKGKHGGPDKITAYRNKLPPAVQAQLDRIHRVHAQITENENSIRGLKGQGKEQEITRLKLANKLLLQQL